MKIGATQPRELAVEHKQRPGSFGHLVAAALLDAPDPLAVQLPVTDINEKELNTTQQAGRRWLDRTGNGDLKLHYRRRNASDAVFYLTRKAQA